MTAPERDPVAEAAAGVKPDYSRVGFRDLQRLVKSRGLPGDGNTAELITKLQAYDVQHGLDVDTTLPADLDEVDLLADDDDALLPGDNADPIAPEIDKPDNPTPDPSGSTPAPEVPSGGREWVASAPPPDGPPADAPAAGLPPATARRGRPDLSTAEGLVRVGAGHGGADIRAFRHTFPLGRHEVTDEMHFRFIAETHEHAAAAGHNPKGGPTVGERVGYGADGNGGRTVIYQVPLRRAR